MRPQRSDNGVTPELRATRTTDPAAEWRKAVHRRDLRFLGVGGVAMTVPGVPFQSAANPVVKIRGVHLIEGTGDFIRSAEQMRLQCFAATYAERYNRLLWEYLVRIRDPAVLQARRQMDEEMAHWERRDPLQDAKQAVREAPPLMLIDIGGDVPGVDRAAWRQAQNEDDLGGRFGYPPWTTLLVAELMTPAQRHRLDRLTARYIAPYNRYAFAHRTALPDRRRR